MRATNAVPPIFYDPQQSHQKTAAGKDDIEPRRTLPKGRVGFNAAACADMTHYMNQGDSYRRISIGWSSRLIWRALRSCRPGGWPRHGEDEAGQRQPVVIASSSCGGRIGRHAERKGVVRRCIPADLRGSPITLRSGNAGDECLSTYAWERCSIAHRFGNLFPKCIVTFGSCEQRIPGVERNRSARATITTLSDGS